MSDCEPNCSSVACSNPFQLLRPYPTLNYGTKIEWQLRSGFSEPGPYTFQLQHGRTGLRTADDWEDVGSAVVDGYYAYDDVKRVYGLDRWTHYRVKLTDGNDVVYYSRPLSAVDANLPANLNRIRSIQRYWYNRQRTRAGGPGVELFVLKRRLYGTACKLCLDYQTGEPTDGNCPTCYGTGIVDGYFDPQGCIYGEFQLTNRRTAIDAELQRGTTGLISQQMLLLADPYLMQNDVLVVAKTDERYYVHAIADAAAVGGVVVMIRAELRLAEYSDIIYDREIPEQTP